MPLGVIVNTLSVVIGGIIGALIGNKLTDDFKEKVNMIFGCCSMAMGAYCFMNSVGARILLSSI